MLFGGLMGNSIEPPQELPKSIKGPENLVRLRHKPRHARPFSGLQHFVTI